MPVIESKLNSRSPEFVANAAAMQALVDDLRAHCERIALGGGAEARAKHVARGKLLPRERVNQLLDPARLFSNSPNSPHSTCMTMPPQLRVSSPASVASTGRSA